MPTRRRWRWATSTTNRSRRRYSPMHSAPASTSVSWRADIPRLWNLTWSVIGDPADGTFYFNNEPNLLDQLLVNKNMATQNSLIRAKPETVDSSIPPHLQHRQVSTTQTIWWDGQGCRRGPQGCALGRSRGGRHGAAGQQRKASDPGRSERASAHFGASGGTTPVGNVGDDGAPHRDKWGPRCRPPRPPGFRRLVKWRTGAEGRISCLKRSYAWDRTRLDGIRIWTGHGILARNLVHVATVI